MIPPSRYIPFGAPAMSLTPSSTMGMAPVAVLPKHQRRGVGSRLIWAGLELCRPIDPVVFVLGDPAYYTRFGFRSAPERGLRFRSSEFDAAFMVIELSPDALAGRTGMVEYLPPFDET